MDTVAIFGVGLIGGSFALALRKAGFRGRIVGVSSARTVEKALEMNVIDAALTPQDAAAQADLLYLAQPIHRIIDSLEELNEWVKPGALITDAGSTKSAIIQRAEQVISRAQFLGGHPMAGRERRGVEAAEADLFEGRPYVLTPTSGGALESPAAREFLSWIPRIGSFPIILNPEEHDRTVAFTSHLPQLVSTALAAMLNNRAEPETNVYGPALVDSTRLALSAYDIWGDIIRTNRHQILSALTCYITKLEEFRRVIEQDIEQDAMARQFEEGSKLATKVRDPMNDLHAEH